MAAPRDADLASAKAGDQDARARLLEPLLAPGYRLAFAILHQREAAEDAVQDACFSALRGLGRFRGADQSLRPWFLAIVADHCRSQLRLHLRWPIPLAESPAGEAPDLSEVDSLDLARELARLGREDRLVLALFYYLDLPLGEVAQVLRVSEAAARSRLYRAVDRLRQRLRQAGAEP